MGSLIIASQIPVEQRNDLIGVPTLADAILDRVFHCAYRVELADDILRKRRSHWSRRRWVLALKDRMPA